MKKIILISVLCIVTGFISYTCYAQDLCSEINKATQLQDQGKYQEAANLLEKLMHLVYNGKNIKDTMLYITLLDRLGSCYLEDGSYNKAENSFKESLKIRKEISELPNIDYANSIKNLANFYLITNKYCPAELLFNQVLEIEKRELGENHPTYANDLSNLATLYQAIGSYYSAELLYIKAYEIRKIVLGEKHPDYTSSLHDLAFLYQTIGQSDKAEALFKRAIEIRKEVLGENHPDYASSLHDLAFLYQTIGQYDKAEALVKQALEIRKKVLGEEHPDYVLSLNALASLYQITGRYNESEVISKQAIKILKISFIENPDYTPSLINLALISLSTGNFDDAENFYLRALEIKGKNLGENHPEYIILLNDIAGFYHIIRNDEKAEAYFIRGNEKTIERLKNTVTCLSLKEKDLLLKSVNKNLDINNSFAFDYYKINPAIADLLIKNQFVMKYYQIEPTYLGNHSLLESGDSVQIATYKKWIDIKEQLNFIKSQSVNKRFADIDSLEKKTDTLEKELFLYNDIKSNALNNLEFRWKDIRNHLINNEAAIEFMNFNYYNGKQFTDSTIYIALLIRPGYEYAKVIPLFEERELYEVLFSDQTVTDNRVIRKNLTPELLREMYRLVWKPLEQNLTGVKTVYLAGSGLLTSIPFHALMKDDTAYLMDNINIHYLYCISDLPGIKTREEPTLQKTAALFGGLNYNKENVSSGGLKSFKYLQGTRSEINQIDAILKMNQWLTYVFTDSLGTEEQFKQMTGVKAPALLHVATHGFCLPSLKTENQNLVKPSINYLQNTMDDPSKLTGLALAGCNPAWMGSKWMPGAEDGLLTAIEISHMDLRKTWLANIATYGYNAVEMYKAFREAGVKNVILGLPYPLSDKITSELMVSFYKNWMESQSLWSAYIFAVKDLRKLYPDEPQKWAAFVMVE